MREREGTTLHDRAIRVDELTLLQRGAVMRVKDSSPDVASADVAQVDLSSLAQGTYFGVVKPESLGRTTNTVWFVEGVDPQQAGQVAPLLDLYFGSQLGAGAPGTSHDMLASSQDRQRVVLAEHVIVRIEKLHAEGKTEQAAALASGLGEALPGLPAAAELKRVFTEAGVTPDARAAVVTKEAAAARERLDAVRREALLRQRLDDTLLPIAHAGKIPEGFTKAGPGGTLLVSVLVGDSGMSARDTAAKLGVHVEDVDEQARVVVGWCPADKLRGLALDQHVRRVEMTRE